MLQKKGNPSKKENEKSKGSVKIYNYIVRNKSKKAKDNNKVPKKKQGQI